MVIGLSGVQFGQLSYKWLTKSDDREVRESLPSKPEGAVELAMEKGASNWLTVILIKETNFNLNKREFRDAIKLR